MFSSLTSKNFCIRTYQITSLFLEYTMYICWWSCGSVSYQMLNRFSCIALAGVATEYLLYGYAEGGLADINKVLLPSHVWSFQIVICLNKYANQEVNVNVLVWQLDLLLNGLGFTQKKADSQVRWSVLNTILILRRHETVRAKLAKAMTAGKSVGSCIEIIEDAIDSADI